jgi:murein L,D-transpeptidase YafK
MRWLKFSAVGFVLVGAVACAKIELAPHLVPLSKETMMLLGKKGMDPASPLYVRVFKEESELEVWKLRADGRYHHLKTYPICNWSGDLGPKVKQGDKQAPEGFYSVPRTQMNPNSQFHLAFNLGYPNAYDRANKRTGDFLMVHGKCKSAGCYAMTDALIEEIYALARESFIGGQEAIPIHAFPFRMTDANMERHKSKEWIGFWQTLKQGYDHFETTRLPPPVTICERKYVVAATPINANVKVNPEGQCPALQKASVEPFTPKPNEKTTEDMVIAPGAKLRGIAQASTGLPAVGQIKSDAQPQSKLGATSGRPATWETSVMGLGTGPGMGLGTGPGMGLGARSTP